MSACSYDSMLIPNWSTGYLVLHLLTFFENAALSENYRLLVDSVLEVGVTLLSGDMSVVHKGAEIIGYFKVVLQCSDVV